MLPGSNWFQRQMSLVTPVDFNALPVVHTGTSGFANHVWVAWGHVKLAAAMFPKGNEATTIAATKNKAETNCYWNCY